MAKKKTKKQRKRHRLNANPKRQANDSLRGYYYQLLHSVHAWLSLADDEILYLEGAEDFDRISPETATATQVKDTQHNITLRFQEVIDAINHYWELQDNHRDMSVKFRFLTRSQIGVERGNPFGEGQAGLHVWKRCSGDEATITKISEFLQTEERISKKVTDFLKGAGPQQIYKQLIEPITWETDSKEASYVAESIKAKLILHGDRQIIPIPPSDSEKVVDSLLAEAWKVATQKENRLLTRVRFLEIFWAQVTKTISAQQWRHYQQMLAATKSSGGAGFIGGSSDITIQSQSPIQTAIPPLYRDVVPRRELLESIQTILQSEGIAVLQGGTGRGKTTLANLTANTINDSSWLWLNFTRKNSSQVVQLLQQLAVEISNQYSPVNIVLDDLDLQPQELRGYEEVLGVVVYRVLERGAKLLITSQYELPGSLSRLLGISSSVAIQVPNFTISEIEQFVQQLGCPTNNTKTWAKLTQLHTSGHPRLVHARLARLREKGWQQDGDESIFQTPREVIEEREEARRLLTDLPEDQQEFLYRLSLMPMEFTKDCVLNIGDIPKSILHPGDIFSQLVGPWIDVVDENYYIVSSLLTNATSQVWSESKIKGLHAQIANAILKAKDLTTIEAHAILFHSMFGQNQTGFITVIQALVTVPEDNWRKLSQEFSWLIYLKTDFLDGLFPGEDFVNYLFRSFQYRIAVEVEPEFASKILEIWDKETTPHQPRQLYLLSRLMLAMQALIYYQVSLPVKQMVGYLKEIIDITDSDKELQEIYGNLSGSPKEYKTDKTNSFSILFKFICARRPFYAPFLSDLIDALDEFDPKIRTLLLADFEDGSVDSRILIDSVWLAEAKLENPDWTRCLQVFDRVIERSLAWGYPHIAAASARGKAIIHDEYLHAPDTAHKVLQDILSKLEPSPVIEEEQAVIHFHQKHYTEALNIYERILPKWNPPLAELDNGPLDGYRQAAICAAHLDDWEKAAVLFEDGVKRAQRVNRTEEYIGLYADAGFAQFKAGNMLNSIKLWHLTLQKFETLPQDNTDVKYFTLKKRLGHTIGWMAGHERESYPLDFEEPPVGFCSNLETNEKFLTLPDFPMGYSWLHLAQIEYKFGHETTALEYALQISDREAYPELNFFLVLLEVQYDFRNKTFDNLPQRIHQMTNACDSIRENNQSESMEENSEDAIYSSITHVPNFASVENITVMLVAALLVQLPTSIDTHKILTIWRINSSELPINDNMIIALDLIESMLYGDKNNALTVMRKPESKYEERLAAALKIVHDIEMNPENLFYAHTLIVTFFTGQTWLDPVMTGLAELLSVQWLKKMKFRAMLKAPMITVPQIEQACNSSETGKKKVGQILLAARQAVSIRVAPETLQQFRSWSE